jgi:DNA excision repair protein ERCC-4
METLASNTVKVLPTPYIVVIDSRENLAYRFCHALAEADDVDHHATLPAGCTVCPACGAIGLPPNPYTFAQPLTGARNRTFTVQTTVAGLTSGDYSLVGYERRVAVERKGLSDLYSTLGGGRARFVRELQRLATYDFAAVVVEAELSVALASPPARSRLNPRSVFASVVAWQQRFPHVHWWFCPGRDVAEAVTIRMLDRYWRDREVRK